VATSIKQEYSVKYAAGIQFEELMYISVFYFKATTHVCPCLKTNESGTLNKRWKLMYYLSIRTTCGKVAI